jgi:hypothetical protein
MGIRSDVAVALKKNVYDGLSQESKETLVEWFMEPVSITEEGVLFYEQGIKWYSQIFEELVALYKNLRDFDEEDYLIVQANHDYPEYVNGDAGGWIENPWEVYRNWSVSIEWTPTEEEINV